MRQIHIIVNCANKKKGPPPDLLLRNVDRVEIEQRAQLWWDELCSTSDAATTDRFEAAHDLYIGHYWSIVRQLPNLSAKQQIETKLWIISAGYGLVSANTLLLPYSATFTRGDVDSVASNSSNARASGSIWWSKLATLKLPQSSHSQSVGSSPPEIPNPRSLSELFRRYSSDHFLVLASSDYLAAIQSDLVNGIDHLEDSSRLIIITSKSAPSVDRLKTHIISTDARLICNPLCQADCDVHFLGRSLHGSIGAILARKCLCEVLYHGHTFGQFIIKIGDELKKSPKLFTHRRTQMSKAHLKSFIRSERKIDASASATRLLRKLRESGQACEQKRFRELFDEVVGGEL
jgi:hypothetical protein